MWVCGRRLAGWKPFDELIEVRERAHGANHPETGVALQNRATAYQRLGRLEAARADYEQTAEIFRQKLTQDNYRRGPGSLNKHDVDCIVGVSMIEPWPAWTECPLNRVNYYGNFVVLTSSKP